MGQERGGEGLAQWVCYVHGKNATNSIARQLRPSKAGAHTHVLEGRRVSLTAHALCPKLTQEQDQRQVDVQGQPDVRVVGRLVVAALPRDARVSAVVCRSRIAVAVIRSETARDGRRASDWRGSKTGQEQKSAEGAPVHHVRSADRGSLLACRWDSMAMRRRGEAIGERCTIEIGAILATRASQLL